MDRERIERTLKLPISSPETRSRLHFQLASSYDIEAEDAGGGDRDMATAMAHYEQALCFANEGTEQYFLVAFYYSQCVLRNERRTLAEIERARALLEGCREWFRDRSPAAAAYASEMIAFIRLLLPGDAALKADLAIDGLNEAIQILDAHRAEVSGKDLAISLVRLGRAFEMRVSGDTAENTNFAIDAYLRAAAACEPEESLIEHAAALRDAAYLAVRSDNIDYVRKTLHGLDRLDALIGADRPRLERLRDLNIRAGLRFHAFELGSSPDDIATADTLYRTAISMQEAVDDTTLQSGLLANHGAVLVRLDHTPEDAEAQLQHAVILAERLAADATTRVAARRHLASFLIDQGRREEAIPLCRAATADLENSVSPDDAEPTLAHLGREAGAIYEEWIDALLGGTTSGLIDCDSAAKAEALNALERNKSRALGVGVAVERAARPPAVPETEWDEYLQLLRRRRFLSTYKLVDRRRRPLWTAPVERRLQTLEDVGQSVVIDVSQRIASAYDDELIRNRERERQLRASIESRAPVADLRPAWPKDSADDAMRLARTGLAIVHFMTTRRATYVLATTSAGIIVHRTPALDAATLHEFLAVAWFQPYNRFRESVRTASVDREAREGWRSAVETFGARLASRIDLGLLWSDLAKIGVSEILFIPYQALHLVPLHLLQAGDGRPICDRFAVSYAPSLSVYRAGQSTARAQMAQGLFVEDPDSTLPFATLDVRLTREFVDNATTFRGKESIAEVVLKAMSQADFIHFSGHASFQGDQPMRSALRLADRDLTMAEITASADLSRCRLALLSACETAQIAITRQADEYTGISGAFLRAGARMVLGTLWAVDDAACPLFDSAFCRILLGGAHTPRSAFAAAQRWLRSVTPRDIPGIVATFNDPSDVAARRLLLFAKYQREQDQPLFAHPQQWGAFCLIGGKGEGEQ